MRQEIRRAIEPCFLPFRDCNAKLPGVPIDDNCGQQVQACNSEVLAFCRAVADFTLSPDPQGTLQRMVGLALVETNVCAALHPGSAGIWPGIAAAGTRQAVRYGTASGAAARQDFKEDQP